MNTSKSISEESEIWFFKTFKKGLLVFIARPGKWLQSLFMGMVSLVLFPFFWWALSCFISLKGIRLKDTCELTGKFRFLFAGEFLLTSILFLGCWFLCDYIEKTPAADADSLYYTDVRYYYLAGSAVILMINIIVYNSLVFYLALKVPSLSPVSVMKTALRQYLGNVVQIMLFSAVVAATGAWLEYHAMSLGLLLKHYIRFNVSHPDILLVICRARHFYLLVMTVYAGSAVYMLRLVSRYLFVSLIDLIKDGRIRIG